MIRYLLIVLLGWLFVATAYAETTPATTSSLAVMAISDIHFDPFIVCESEKIKPCPLITKLRAASAENWPAILKQYDVTAPAMYRDTDYTLLVTMLASAKQAAQEDHVKFVLVLGDFLGHEYRQHYRVYAKDKSRANYQAFVKKTMAFLLAELKRTFPNLDIFIVSGNNDGYHYDYYVDANGAYFHDLSEMGAKLVLTPKYRAELAKTFSYAGYYAVELNPQLRLLMLNSVLFSYKAKGPQLSKVASQELDWLHQQLLLAKEQHQRVLIAMHIPEGKDFYLLSSVKLFRMLDLWHENEAARFNAEIAQFAPEIAGILTGHLHWDSLHTLHFDNAKIDVVGVPAISPIFGSRPGFTTLFYSVPGYELDDKETFVYSFSGVPAERPSHSVD